MLFLKRRQGEEIIINDEIRILVRRTTNGGCVLAIEAPDCCRIRRSEVPDFQEDVIQTTASAWQVQS